MTSKFTLKKEEIEEALERYINEKHPFTQGKVMTPERVVATYTFTVDFDKDKPTPKATKEESK